MAKEDNLEFEGEVINRDLVARVTADNDPDYVTLTPPIPSTASGARLIIPIVAAIAFVFRIFNYIENERERV